MRRKYTRLKLKMLLFVVAGTLVAGLAGLFLLEVVVDGVLQDPFARFFVWAARTLFGQSEYEALELYRQAIRGNKQAFLTAGMLVLMLAAFYLAMGRFTRWLEEIRLALRRVVEEQDAPVRLPRELSPLQEDLDALQRQMKQREDAARESEQRKQDLVAFLAHDLKTPLTSVVGYLTLLRDEPGLDAAQRAKFTGIALDKAERLEELLGEFFDITRMDLDSGAGERHPIQLSMLLEQLSDEFYPLCSATRTNLPGSSITCCATRSATVRPAAGWRSGPGRWNGRPRSSSGTRDWRSPKESWPIFSTNFTGWTPPAPPGPAGRDWALPLRRRSWSCTGARSGRRATGALPAS